MIQELVNYSEWLKKDFPDLFEGIVFEGLHIEVSLDRNGELKENGFNFEIYRKGNIPSNFLLKLAKNENIGEMIPIYIIKNKYIDASAKFFSSNNYYSYFFKLFKENNNELKLSKAFNFKPRTTKLTNNDYKDKFENYIKKYKELFNKNLKKHYNFLKNSNASKSIIPKKSNGYFEIEKDFEHIKEYLENRFWNKFLKEEVISHFITHTTNHSKEISKTNKDLLTKTIFLTFTTPHFKENLKKQAVFYYKKRLFLKKPNNYEKKYKITGEWPYIFNPILTQDNEDKIFSRHQSHFSKINKKLHSNKIITTINLLKLVYNGKLPNPLPIFLNKDELNKKVVTIYKQGDTKKSYIQIIKSIIIDHAEDLQNYYIINYSKGKSLIINDVDFISNFKFWINIKWNQKLFELFNINKTYDKIEHIFHLEQIFKNKIFGNELIYFGDLDFSKETPNFQKNNIYKYRKLFYDAFYKSRLHLITANIFKDICMPVIRYEISHDEMNNKGYSKNEFKIKERLLIYLHLNQLVDLKHNNFGGIKMTARLPDFYHKTRELIRNDKKIDEDAQIDSDELWAFSAGQLIYYLLSRSKTSNKSHAMFEPFLRKFNDINAFKKQILSTYEKYKHEIDLNNTRFNQLASKVIDYPMSNEKLKEFEVIVYSGYFAKSLLYESQKGE